jgi:MFS-type transporter involved in bile tolerance (Atg22 family)
LYGSSLCEIAVPGYGNVLQIFLMFVEMLGCYICIFLISRIGRRPLIHFGTIVSIITNVVTGIGYLPHFYVNNDLSLGQIIPLMIMLFVYMLVYGASLGPITFSYVP